MKITSLKAQLKNPDRVSIYVDGKYEFSLNQSQLLAERLHSGLEIDESRLVALKKISEQGKIYERILAYVLLRPRAQKEVVDYCRRKQITPEDCRAMINKLSQRGYLDDASFARSWVESRQLHKAASRRQLHRELRQKGVSEDIVAKVLTSDEYDERAALKKLIAKKRKLSRYKDVPKLTQYLVRQGSSFDDIKSELAGE